MINQDEIDRLKDFGLLKCYQANTQWFIDHSVTLAAGFKFLPPNSDDKMPDLSREQLARILSASLHDHQGWRKFVKKQMIHRLAKSQEALFTEPMARYIVHHQYDEIIRRAENIVTKST